LAGCSESSVSPLEPSLAKRQDAAMAMTVLIVDDHPTFRSFARDLLASEGFEVIGEAGDGASAVEAATSLRPALVLLDVQLPDMSGFEVVERLRENDVASAVVLTSSRDASTYGDQVDSCGAIGFLPKAELSGQAVRALLQEAS
jgi:DNA-binding NarL/FixJ family response regulator